MKVILWWVEDVVKGLFEVPCIVGEGRVAKDHGLLLVERFLLTVLSLFIFNIIILLIGTTKLSAYTIKLAISVVFPNLRVPSIESLGIFPVESVLGIILSVINKTHRRRMWEWVKVTANQNCGVLLSIISILTHDFVFESTYSLQKIVSLTILHVIVLWVPV